jgi:hypothetical protein
MGKIPAALKAYQFGKKKTASAKRKPAGKSSKPGSQPGKFPPKKK